MASESEMLSLFPTSEGSVLGKLPILIFFYRAMSKMMSKAKREVPDWRVISSASLLVWVCLAVLTYWMGSMDWIAGALLAIGFPYFAVSLATANRLVQLVNIVEHALWEDGRVSRGLGRVQGCNGLLVTFGDLFEFLLHVWLRNLVPVLRSICIYLAYENEDLESVHPHAAHLMWKEEAQASNCTEKLISVHKDRKRALDWLFSIEAIAKCVREGVYVEVLEADLPRDPEIPNRLRGMKLRAQPTLRIVALAAMTVVCMAEEVSIGDNHDQGSYYLPCVFFISCVAVFDVRVGVVVSLLLWLVWCLTLSELGQILLVVVVWFWIHSTVQKQREEVLKSDKDWDKDAAGMVDCKVTWELHVPRHYAVRNLIKALTCIDMDVPEHVPYAFGVIRAVVTITGQAPEDVYLSKCRGHLQKWYDELYRALEGSGLPGGSQGGESSSTETFSPMNWSQIAQIYNFQLPDKESGGNGIPMLAHTQKRFRRDVLLVGSASESEGGGVTDLVQVMRNADEGFRHYVLKGIFGGSALPELESESDVEVAELQEEPTGEGNGEGCPQGGGWEIEVESYQESSEGSEEESGQALSRDTNGDDDSEDEFEGPGAKYYSQLLLMEVSKYISVRVCLDKSGRSSSLASKDE